MVFNLDTLVAMGGGGALLVRTYVPAVGVAVGKFVYQMSDGRVALADATSELTAPSLGVVTTMDAPVSGQCVVRYDGDADVFTGLVAGEVYVLSTIPGAIVMESADPDTTPGYPKTSGNIWQDVGIALSSTTLFVGAVREMEGV